MSTAFGTLYAEAQRRYLESVSPYARRLSTKWRCPKSMPSRACRPPLRYRAARITEDKIFGRQRDDVIAIGMLSRITESIRHQTGAAGSDASDSIRACCLSSAQNSEGILPCSEL